SPTGAADPQTHRRGPAPAPIWAAYGLLGVLLIGYLISLIVRPPGDDSTWLDGWAMCAFELVACALAIGRGLVKRPGRAVCLTLGAAMGTWAIGDVALTYESLGGASPPTPSVADIFYLAFFPLAYLGLALMLRRESTRLVPATWLDGAVAGLGAAALCAAFAFHSIAHVTGGGAAAVATNLAYPLGDVLLLAMVVGGSAMVSGRGGRAWLFLAAGCALNAVGDTFNLFGSSGTHVGIVVDGLAWPTAIWLMSMAVWLRPGRADVLGRRPAPGFLLPGLGAASSLAVLLLGSMHPIALVAVGLAAATLAIVGVRLALSVRSLRTLTEERHRQAVTDQLTGLGNRRRLAHVLETFFADHENSATDARSLAFLFVDLNHFKEINDSFGHPAGDQLLTQIGPRIQTCLGQSDLLVRIGGDELAVILLDSGAERAARVAERLSATLHDPFVLDMVSVRIGASIGIALAPGHAVDADELMRCADRAMYRSKRGGSPFEIHDEQLDSDSDRLRLVEELRTAIAGHEFELHYQPQINLRDGTITAVEALLRWPHPRLGYIPPLDFLPLAEEAGLMRELTTMVLEQALDQCSRWRAAGRTLSVSVNVSATNILDIGFSDLIRRQLVRHNLPPSALVLEITETTIISDFERCKRVVDELCELGCVVSIDDFGAGFTSLPYLSRLTIGELKLDRTFLAELATGEGHGDSTLIRATIDLAHALGLQVVAEGVEEQATLDHLSRLGCDLAQGYHIGRPTPAASVLFESDLAA
ncbi:MAG TPA: bifunctional diguanylate cyclase/phosphodiesterase, partial [Gaiellales bacterium]